MILMRQIFVLTAALVFFVSACTFTRKVRTGMQAYEVKQYSVATQLFAEEYESTTLKSDRAILAFYAGESFSQMGEPQAAADWYLKASENGYGPEANESYADALKKQEKYAEAMAVYEELFQQTPGNAGYRANVNLCRQAYEWSNQKNESVTITSAEFNSPGADYSPVPTGPGELMFTSDWDPGNGDTYLWTGRGFSNIYEVNITSGIIDLFDDVINTEKNEGTGVIDPEGGMMVFTRCYVKDDYDAWCKLMYSYLRGGIWSTPEPFWFVKEGINYGHPAFAANGTTLFFSSDDPAGQGGHDLYISQFDPSEGWSEPVNIGGAINTSGNEQYPTVFGDTLYFSSDKLAGLGGLDIFKTYLAADGSWVSPINLRAPFNSGGDDFGFVIDTFTPLTEGNIMHGYFTSSRNGGAGGDDIYAFSVSGIKDDIEIVDQPVEEIPEEELIDYQLYLVLRVMEPQFKDKGDPNSPRIGMRPLPNGPIIVTEGVTDQRFVTDELGQFLTRLEWGKAYTFTAKYRDHLAVKYTLNTAEIEKDPNKPNKTITEIMVLDPIFKNKEIVIDSIFYDFDQWAIREDARPPLDKLSAILKNNPQINIQLSSYTDCRGTEEYNLDLSQKRAEAAIEYLKSTGIPARRMIARGFGESNLVVNCECESCTEEEHQANRLTTFKILE